MRLQNGVLPNYSTDGKLRCLHRSDSKYGREKHIFADVVKHMQQTMGHANPFEVSREAQKIHIGISIETDTVSDSSDALINVGANFKRIKSTDIVALGNSLACRYS